MDAPKCRLCGQKHYGVAHIWPKEQAAAHERGIDRTVETRPDPQVSESAAAPKPKVVRPVVTAETAGVESPVAVGGVTTEGKKQGWDRDKYNTYQREYMRKRRAK